jgi:hypothetical protein
MPLTAISVPIAPRGLATAFGETETPEQYALQLRNRFISAAGGAEKRQGMTQYGSNLPITVNRLHELVNNKTLVATLFASGSGRIYRHSSGSWVLAYSSGTSSAVYRSVQNNDKLIFYNGVDRPIYTTNGSTFYELRAIVEAGLSSAGTDKDSLHCDDVTTWHDTDVAVGDIVQYEPTGAIGCVTVVATASVVHTEISSTSKSAAGFVADAYVLTGKAFKIIDTIESNIVPTSDPEYFDNYGLLATDSSATGMKIAGITDWTTTGISVGDYIRNTTRTAVAIVTAVTTSAFVRHTGVSGQASGDSVLLYKSAMPRPSFAHVHYGRTYFVDSNDRTRVRVSGPNNPQDMTTDSGTLDGSSVSFGAIQPEGDAVQALTSYQRFLIMAGKRYTVLYEGTDPIADTTAMESDFSVVGMFPQGVMSPDGLLTIGNDAVIVSRDGIQGFSLQGDASTVGRENLSEALKNVLRVKIQNASEDQIVGFHYPKRSWVCFKIGNELYVYNYTPYFGEGRTSEEGAFSVVSKGGSWSIFDGLIAEQTHYYVGRDGNLYSCKGNKVYLCDVEGVFTDDGSKYTTTYQTAWLKGQPGSSQNTKLGMYIQPVFNALNTTYTITAEAPFIPDSNARVTSNRLARSGPVGVAVIGSYAIGGRGEGGISDKKYPLLWRGKEVRFTITTNDDGGPDTISRLIVMYTTTGVR